EELLAEPGEVAQHIEQASLGLGQRLEGDGLATAAQEGLDEVEGQRRDAEVGPAAEGDDGAVGKAGQQQRSGAEELGNAEGRVHPPAVGEPLWCTTPEALTESGLDGEPLRHEGEALDAHGQGGQVELFAAGLVLPAIDQAKLDRLFELD